MNTSNHFEIRQEISRREAAVVAALLNDLRRTVQFLSVDIVTEEDRTAVRDMSDPRYSTLARTLDARRRNLTATIASLERRLSAITADREAVAA